MRVRPLLGLLLLFALAPLDAGCLTCGVYDLSHERDLEATIGVPAELELDFGSMWVFLADATGASSSRSRLWGKWRDRDAAPRSLLAEGDRVIAYCERGVRTEEVEGLPVAIVLVENARAFYAVVDDGDSIRRVPALGVTATEPSVWKTAATVPLYALAVPLDVAMFPIVYLIAWSRIDEPPSLW